MRATRITRPFIARFSPACSATLRCARNAISIKARAAGKSRYSPARLCSTATRSRRKISTRTKARRRPSPFLRSSRRGSWLASRGGKREEETDDNATRIFRPTIKKPPLPLQYSFLEHNHRVRQKIETWQTRVRRHDLGNLDEKLFEFYAQRIGAPGTVPACSDRTLPLAGTETGVPNPQSISSVHELNRLIRDCGGPEFLCATENDLTGGQELSFDAEAF